MAEDDFDPAVAVDCPDCDEPMVFLATKPGDWLFLYACKQHGLFVVSPDAPQPVPFTSAKP
jgi:hypothetical protein